MIRISGFDKPHRCPTCWTIPDLIWESHNRARRLWLYTCRNGHRFIRVPRPLAAWRMRRLRASWRRVP